MREFRDRPSLKFRLFGEWKIFLWIFGGVLALVLAVYGLIGYVIAHFISKYW